MFRKTGLPINNSDFGDAHGVVKLSSVSESTLSTDAYLNKKVKVFFKKDDMNPNTFAPFQEPNWSYYWKQFVDKKNITDFRFVLDNNMEFVCGSPSALACVHKFQTEVYYRQKASENSGWTTNKGIHTFTEILALENKHIEINKFLWPNGYDKDLDKDGDKYPEWFELSEEGIKYGFQVNDICDSYSKISGCENKQLYEDLDWYLNSAGFKYEEKNCVKAQKEVQVDSNDYLDWSYDLKNIYQGKNWK